MQCPPYIANIEHIEFYILVYKTHCILSTHCRPSKQAPDVDANTKYKIQINEHLHGIVCLEYTCVFIQRKIKTNRQLIWKHTRTRIICVAQSACSIQFHCMTKHWHEYWLTINGKILWIALSFASKSVIGSISLFVCFCPQRFMYSCSSFIHWIVFTTTQLQAHAQSSLPRSNINISIHKHTRSAKFECEWNTCAHTFIHLYICLLLCDFSP